MKKKFKNPGEILGFFFRKLVRTGKIPGLSAVIIILFFVTLILLFSSKKKVVVQYCVPATLTFSGRNIHVSTIGYGAAGTPKRTVLIFPASDSAETFEIWYAKKLCDAGFNTYVVTGWTKYPMERLDQLQEKPEKAISAIVSSVASRFIGVLASGESVEMVSPAVRKIKRVNAAYFVTSDDLSLKPLPQQEIEVVKSVPWTAQFRDVIKFFLNAEKSTLENAN